MKHVYFKISDELYRRMRIKALKKKLSMKDFISMSISREINRRHENGRLEADKQLRETSKSK